MGEFPFAEDIAWRKGRDYAEAECEKVIALERAKVKRLELRLRYCRALALGNHLAFLGAHAGDAWRRRWCNRRMHVGAIIRKTRLELWG